MGSIPITFKRKKPKYFRKILGDLKKKGMTMSHFYKSKKSAVLEPRTGHFRRLVDFKAKDLSFEAKAKNFNVCPRGQARLRGLLL